MSDNVVFQTGQVATPPNATTVATDNVGGRHFQQIKLGFGDDGTVYLLSYGTPLPIGTISGGTISILGTIQGSGTFQPLAGSMHVASRIPGTVDIGTIAGTISVLGTVQLHGTNQALGTYQPLAGSMHIASALVGGTVSIAGSVWGGTVHIANAITGTTSFVTGGTAHIGSVQRLAGGTINSFGGTIGGGTVQTHGTTEVVGTVQQVASMSFGSVQGWQAHDSAAVGNPILLGAFGSSGTPTAVNEQDVARLWTDLNGRLQIRGTIDSMPAVSVTTGTIPGGTVQAFGTTQILGTVATSVTTNVTVGTIAEGTINSFTGTAQILGTVAASVTVNQGTIPGGTIQLFGTSQIIGTTQPLAGSVHLASRIPGTVDIGTVAGTVSVLGTFQPLAGSVHVANVISGTTSFITGGTAHIGSVQHIAGTVGVGTVAGTVSTLGTLQPLAGSVHLASRVPGTVDIGTVAGTISALGTYQPLDGSIHVASRIPGTVDIGTVAGTVRIGAIAGSVSVGAISGTLPGGTVIAQAGGFGSYFGTALTAAVSSGTLIAPTAAGTKFRIFDITVSAQASGTFYLGEAATAVAGTAMFGPLFFAGSGGWQFNSNRGILARNDARGLFVTTSAGTMSVTVNYSLEGTV